MAGVEPGVAGGGVVQLEVVLQDLLRAAQALGHVVAGQLDVDASRPGSGIPMYHKESLDLAQNVVEAAGLAAGRGGEGVAVHGIAGPHHRVGRFPYCLYERR